MARALGEELGLGGDEVHVAGPAVVKVPVSVVRERSARGRSGRLLLVTGMTPTSHGEGKTVTAIGTAMALRAAGHRAVAVLRQPSMGPVFGVKGGATGGGRATVEPADRINLGFTGDLHAVAAAHNLLAALVNNAIFHGDGPAMDPARVLWPWTVDVEDRALRHVVAEAASPTHAVRRDGRFVITAASEVTAVLGLAKDYADLRARLARIIVGYDRAGGPVRAGDLGAAGAMAALLRDALEPNLVAARDGTPVIVHGGPFGNIAHGTASRLGIELGLAAADYCVVEAGFATDLGAEKFVDIVARDAGLNVDAGLLVATVRGLRRQGGVPEAALDAPDVGAVERGLSNLAAHIENLRRLGVDPVIALNRFPGDAAEEVDRVRTFAQNSGVALAPSTAFAEGADGAHELAERAQEIASRGGRSRPAYPASTGPRDAMEVVARGFYGAGRVDYDPAASAELDALERIGERGGPICVAKTALSLSDDPKVVGRPVGYDVRVRRVQRSAGAGFTVLYLGEIETMPGLPRHPLAERIDLTADGRIDGLS